MDWFYRPLASVVTQPKQPEWKVVEHVAGVWSYHLRDASRPNASTARAACGAPVMTCGLPLRAWGFKGHLNEKYCASCAAHAGITK